MKSTLRKWRLVLGSDSDNKGQVNLPTEDTGMNEVLDVLYGPEKKGGLGSSTPAINRWLGDIRKYFPASVIELMQHDALERLSLEKILNEPELSELLIKNVNLVGTILSLKKVLPEKTRHSARIVVRKVVDELVKKLSQPLRQAVDGAMRKTGRNLRPKQHEIDWHRTIKANLKNYQVDYATIIPKYFRGYQRKRPAMRHIVLLVDQSGSMASSVVYAGVFGSVIASLPSLKTSFIVFDTSVVDLSDLLDDPVDLLFGVQLGGGTDIGAALSFASQLIDRPEETIVILISDLYEGGNAAFLLQKAKELVASGVIVIAVLALNNDGAPSFDRQTAGSLAALSIPSFACTPDNFPEILAAAINRQDLSRLIKSN